MTGKNKSVHWVFCVGEKNTKINIKRLQPHVLYQQHTWHIHDCVVLQNPKKLLRRQRKASEICVSGCCRAIVIYSLSCRLFGIAPGHSATMRIAIKKSSHCMVLIFLQKMQFAFKLICFSFRISYKQNFGKQKRECDQ